jgi:methionyl aminopeptidase
MSIETPAELEKLRAIGGIVARTLRALSDKVCPGVTTAELDEYCARMLAQYGARSSPPMVYGFPGSVCISVNDEVVHGIPGNRVLQSGDLVKLDLTAEKDGFHTDAAVSMNVPPASSTGDKLACCAESAFHKALRGSRRQSRKRYRPGRRAGRAPQRFPRRPRTLRPRHRTHDP